MNSPLPYFWNRCVDFYREVCRIPANLNAKIAERNEHIEFSDCLEALRTLHDELPSLIPFTSSTEQTRLKELVLEATERYNTYLEKLQAVFAKTLSVEEINLYHAVELRDWTEQNLLEYVASLVVPSDGTPPNTDIVESTQQLFELKPNIAGIGLNLNALITWLRSRRVGGSERRNG